MLLIILLFAKSNFHGLGITNISILLKPYFIQIISLSYICICDNSTWSSLSYNTCMSDYERPRQEMQSYEITHIPNSLRVMHSPTGVSAHFIKLWRSSANVKGQANDACCEIFNSESSRELGLKCCCQFTGTG